MASEISGTLRKSLASIFPRSQSDKVISFVSVAGCQLPGFFAKFLFGGREWEGTQIIEF